MLERSGGGRFSRPRPGVHPTHPWRSVLFPFALRTPAALPTREGGSSAEAASGALRDAPNHPGPPPPSPGPRGLSPASPARPGRLRGSSAREGRVSEPGNLSAQDPGPGAEGPGRSEGGAEATQLASPPPLRRPGRPSLGSGRARKG